MREAIDYILYNLETAALFVAVSTPVTIVFTLATLAEKFLL